MERYVFTRRLQTTGAMNENDAQRLAETLEAIAIAEAMELLIRHTEDNGHGDMRTAAMLIFFRSLLNKYKRRTRNIKIQSDAYGDVKVIDNELRKFNKN